MPKSNTPVKCLLQQSVTIRKSLHCITSFSSLYIRKSLLKILLKYRKGAYKSLITAICWVSLATYKIALNWRAPENSSLLRVRFYKKIQDWIFNWIRRNPENKFCVSLLNRSIKDLSGHGTSKEPKNPFPEWILRFLWRTVIREIFD